MEARLAKLRSAVANDDETAEKELDALLSDHAERHLDMILRPSTAARFIIDADAGC